jgi:hypothetical protein
LAIEAVWKRVEWHSPGGAPLCDADRCSGSHRALLPPAHKTAWLSLEPLAAFEAALRSGRNQWICPASRGIGFHRTSAAWTGEDAQWTGFGLAAQTAAAAAGFHPRTARQFVGALGEMTSNIYEHSGLPASGIAAYRASGGLFEFAVVDGGMGVLESLRTCPEYAALIDHGEALRLALAEGVSRFGPHAERGHGFRPIFVGLANLSGSLRFRSGDHALVIDGQKVGAMPAKGRRRHRLKAFSLPFHVGWPPRAGWTADLKCTGLGGQSPKISRLHIDRTLDPEVGNVDVPRLAPECAARVWPAAVLGFIASAMRKGEDVITLTDSAEQRREVDKVLGDDVDHPPLPLHLAATPDHVRRENEPALPLEQGRPDDEIRDVGLVFEGDEQDALG